MERKYQFQRVDFWVQSIIGGSIILSCLSSFVFPGGWIFGILGLMPFGAWQVLSGVVFGIFYRDRNHLLYLAGVAVYFLTAYWVVYDKNNNNAAFPFLAFAAFIGVIYFVWTRFDFINADKTPTDKSVYFDDILDA